MVDFFIASGIDIDKDYEIIQIGKENDQLHLYGAWFNFIGQQTSGPECKEPHANGGFSTKYFDLTDNFSIAFISGNKPFAESYFDKVEQPVVEVNLLFKIPWVIQAEEP